MLSWMAATGHRGDPRIIGKFTSLRSGAFCIILAHLMLSDAVWRDIMRSARVGCRYLSNVFSDFGAILD